MIFKVFNKKELHNLFNIMASRNRVVGPVKTGTDVHGDSVYAFSDISDYKELKLDYPTARLPAKRFFLPFVEDLSTFHIEGDMWEERISYPDAEDVRFTRKAHALRNGKVLQM
jgi:hypothetical protein